MSMQNYGYNLYFKNLHFFTCRIHFNANWLIFVYKSRTKWQEFPKLILYNKIAQ